MSCLCKTLSRSQIQLYPHLLDVQDPRVNQIQFSHLMVYAKLPSFINCVELSHRCLGEIVIEWKTYFCKCSKTQTDKAHFPL